MFNIDDYLQRLIAECKTAFGARLMYIGLQGSYLRGEATDESDIDIMLILEDLGVGDMDAYREILKSVGSFEKSCGFICGKDEMLRWNPLEVCQLLNTTKDLFGELKGFLPSATREDELNYVKLSLGNLYHELCHRYIHSDRSANIAKFRRSCKSAFFLIQNLHYLESGIFAATKRELKARVSEDDRAILEMADLPDDYDFDAAFRIMFRWCGDAFRRAELIRDAEQKLPEAIMLTQHEPTLEDLWFRQMMLSDEETMAYNHAWGGTIPFPKEDWRDWFDYWIVNNEGKRYYRYLKNNDGQFVGEIAYHYDADIQHEIANIIIYSPYRGKGFGSEGLALLCSAAKNNGVSILYDDIAIDNPAIKLFLKHGFVEEYRTEEKVFLIKKM